MYISLNSMGPNLDRANKRTHSVLGVLGFETSVRNGLR